MQKLDIPGLLDRFSSLQSQRLNWEQRWREIATYVAPTRYESVSSLSDAVNPKEPQIYDATAIMAAENLASGIFGLITDPGGTWFRLTLNTPNQDSSNLAAQWLEHVEARIRQAFATGGNHFYSQVPDFFRDLICFGTAAFYVDLRRDMQSSAFAGLNFHTRALSEIYIDQNANREVHRVYRKFSLSAQQILAAWPQAELPEIKMLVDHNQGEDPIDILHIVEPNLNFDPSKVGQRGKPFRSVYIDLSKQAVIAQGGYFDMPYQIARWSLARGGVYGTSQAMLALPDIRTLNAMAKTSLLAAQKAVDPPILVPHETGMQGIKTHPGAVIVGGLDPNGRRLFEPFQQGQGLSQTLEMEQQRRQAIKEAFHASLLFGSGSSAMTATEFLGRQDERMRLMSPYLGRIQSEFLDPLIKRVYGLLSRAGQLPKPPEELGLKPDISVSYLSPLAFEQKRSEAQALLKTYQALSPMGQSNPDIMSQFDMNKAARLIADGLGAPASVFRPEIEAQL